jgi:predicted CXXCH cytochrome family protein
LNSRNEEIGGSMKRITPALLAAAVAIIVASPGLAYTGTYTPGTGINGTPHDLGTVHNGMNYTAVPADTLRRICIFCHAPHNTYRLSPVNGGPGAGVGAGPQAPDAYNYLPLWNHTLPGPVPTYTMYGNDPGAPQSGPKASQAAANGMIPGNGSLLCLSCHDGSIAVNSYGNSAQLEASVSTGTARILTRYQIGKDSYLGNHHPIGFDYDAVQAEDTQIRPADAAFIAINSPVREHLFGGQVSGENRVMECATCHSVHNTGNTGERLLWRSDQNSELCLTCHAKGTYTAP